MQTLARAFTAPHCVSVSVRAEQRQRVGGGGGARATTVVCRARSTDDGDATKSKGVTTRRRVVSQARRDVRAAAATGQTGFNLEDVAKPFISAKETLNEGKARCVFTHF